MARGLLIVTSVPMRLALLILALTELSAEQRQVLELAYFEGQSCSEISDRIGIPIGTVKSRLAAALGKLRQTLGAASPPGTVRS